MKWPRFWRRERSSAAAPRSAIPTLPSADVETLTARLASLRPATDAEALRAFRVTLAEQLTSWPDHGELRLLDARALRLQGRADEALAVCDSSLGLDCDAVAVHLEMAECHRQLHATRDAIEAVQVALALDDDHGAAWLMLADLLLRSERPAEAGAAAERATHLLIQPRDRAIAWFRVGQAALELGRTRRALEALEQSQALDSTLSAALVALGHARLLEEDDLGAIAAYERAINQLDTPTPNLRLNLGIARMNVGQYDGARAMIEPLLQERPADHVARWYLCQLDLLQCHWSNGWANHPARFGAGCSPYRPMPYAPWRGQPLSADEPLLILADQGLGDEIMFASCLPDVARRAPQCIVECEPRLLALFQRSFPGLHFIATQRENDTRWLDGQPAPRWQLAAGDLPGLFRQSDEDFPNHRGYLQADPVRVTAWRQRLASELGPGLKVGISWRGGLATTRTKARTLQPEHWTPILQQAGVRFVNLQYGQYAEELAALSQLSAQPIQDYPQAIADYDDTAALVGALDLVITVCTAIVHLSGALGRPVWVLTPHAPGWRYTADRHVMPWYPSSRIFRQSQVGEWATPCQEVSLALNELTKGVTPFTQGS